MLRAEILATLCCPENHSAVKPASESLIKEINTAIRLRSLRNRGGQLLEQPITGALVRADGDVVYPIIDDIPVLVRSEGISIQQLGSRVSND